MARRRDQDSPWKELLEYDFERFLAFFFSRIHADLDWSRDVESLDQEFRPMVPASPNGRRVADKLLKHHRQRNGDPRYFHVEIQARREKRFAHRVHIYNMRAEDRYSETVTSLVLLVDDHPTWRPRQYRGRRYGCTRGLTFKTAKLLDWRGHEEHLLVDANPVALFVLAELEARRTRADTTERERVKLALIVRLVEYKMDSESVRHWYRYLDWLLPLPIEGEARVAARARQIEEESKVPFVTYAERVGMEKGREKGREEGREKGLEEGRQGLLEALKMLLKIKFGDAGLHLAAELQTAKFDRLQTILSALESAESVDDLRGLGTESP